MKTLTTFLPGNLVWIVPVQFCHFSAHWQDDHTVLMTCSACLCAVAYFKVFMYLTLAYDLWHVRHALIYGVLHKIFIGIQTVKIFLLLLELKVYHCVHRS